MKKRRQLHHKADILSRQWDYSKLFIGRYRLLLLKKGAHWTLNYLHMENKFFRYFATMYIYIHLRTYAKNYYSSNWCAWEACFVYLKQSRKNSIITYLYTFNESWCTRICRIFRRPKMFQIHTLRCRCT